MRADSVLDLKLTLAEKYGAEPDTPGMAAYAAATGRRQIPGISLGKTRKGRAKDGFRLLIVTTDDWDQTYEQAQDMIEVAGGEADHLYLFRPASPRITREWSQRTKRYDEIGQQVRPAGANWVGTGSIFVPAAEDPDIWCQLTNKHVSGFGAKRGDVMLQGTRKQGVHWGSSNLSVGAPGMYDSALSTISADKAYWWYSQALDENLVGMRAMRDSDIGFNDFRHTGQTRGTIEGGTCFAKDIDDLPIAFDQGVIYMSGMAAFRKAGSEAFSFPGHSGSAIKDPRDRKACCHLNSGGTDGSGEDVTFGIQDMPGSVVAAGGLARLVG